MGIEKFGEFVDEVVAIIDSKIWCERKKIGDPTDIVLYLPRLNFHFSIEHSALMSAYVKNIDPEYNALMIIDKIKHDVMQHFLYKYTII